MLFKWELIEKIAAGQKTQTRRPANLEKEFINRDNALSVYVNNRLKWQVGRDYAVQYGRGLPTVIYCEDTNELVPYAEYIEKFGNPSYLPLRIKLTNIRYEDVRNISHEDSIAEGFSDNPKLDFLYTWGGFYNKPSLPIIASTLYDGPNACPNELWNYHDELYQAWALSFEVVLP